MKKKQQQIRCSSGASIAGRTDSPLQVTRLFFFVYFVFFHLSCRLLFLTHPTPPSIKPLSVSLTLFVSWTLLKLCPLSSPCCLSSLEPVGRTWFLTGGCFMVVFFSPSQTRGLPPRRTRDPTGNSLDQVPGTATSGGNEVVRLHHGGGPEAFLQGQSLS